MNGQSKVIDTEDSAEPVGELRQGDPRLLATALAQRLLAAAIPARVAYIAIDGTPRVVPMNFVWNGRRVGDGRLR
jgi:hypothetical protein